MHPLMLGISAVMSSLIGLLWRVKSELSDAKRET
jgi:hypothetical protein